MLVLEELDHALKRDAHILAEVLGYGVSCDANHVTAPSSDGDGARRCMESAIRDARLDIDQIGYINAHATSTPLGDAAESKAIVDLFGELSGDILVSSTKGATGHLLGAAGCVEAVFTTLACHEGIVPPTANLDKPSTGCNLNYVYGDHELHWNSKHSPRISITNSFGFGGTNASIVFSEYVH